MSHVTIELEDKIARQLASLAKQQGVTLEEYLQGVAKDKATTEHHGKQTKRSNKEREVAFDKWVASFPKRPGVVMDDSRESIYEGRGE